MENVTHEKLSITDSIALVGELEHLRRHIIRSVQYMNDEDNKLFWLIQASKIQELRREYMRKYFPVDEKYWCIIKSCATLRQIAYETFNKDVEEITAIDLLIDECLGEVLKTNLSGCEACREDQADAEES